MKFFINYDKAKDALEALRDKASASESFQRWLALSDAISALIAVLGESDTKIKLEKSDKEEKLK